MGACCSKTNSTITSTHTPPEVKIQQPEKSNNTAIAIFASAKEHESPKKDVFVVKHRKSHEIDKHPDQETRQSIDQKKTPNSDDSQSAKTNSAGAGGVRTSSCTKEEVDAILIQCGRLSRSSSGVNLAGGETPTRGRRFSGSKRSFDFDMEMNSRNDEPRVSSPLRRRSRERDPQQQKSGNGNGGRRVSRSPNRRSESPNPNSSGGVAATGGGGNRPGKMVSVPATDKSNSVGGGVAVVAACSRAAASPRSRSAARTNLRVFNQNPNQNQQPVTLSRSNSKKVEHSPYQRNPLGEIDTNIVGTEQPSSKKPIEKMMNNKTSKTKNIIAKETQMLDQIVSRTRSSRLSRDLDINPESLINPNPPSYASLILEDIQNFHQEKDSLEETDDMMEASLHKYVTVRRGGDADTEDKESSGSNSFAGSQQLSWMSSSWEPNSGDSSDCWTSKSRSDRVHQGAIAST